MVPMVVSAILLIVGNSLGSSSKDSTTSFRDMQSPIASSLAGEILTITDLDEQADTTNCCVYKKAIKAARKKGLLKVKRSDIITEQPSASHDHRNIRVGDSHEVCGCTCFGCKEDPTCLINCCCLTLCLTKICLAAAE